MAHDLVRFHNVTVAPYKAHVISAWVEKKGISGPIDAIFLALIECFVLGSCGR